MTDFIINIPEVEGWEQLRDYLKTFGYEEVKLDYMIECEVKAIKPLPRPSCLIFYERYKYSN